LKQLDCQLQFPPQGFLLTSYLSYLLYLYLSYLPLTSYLSRLSRLSHLSSHLSSLTSHLSPLTSHLLSLSTLISLTPVLNRIKLQVGEGGLARFRLFGTALPPLPVLTNVLKGAKVLWASDASYGSPELVLRDERQGRREVRVRVVEE
jgi:hypothetical protein